MAVDNWKQRSFLLSHLTLKLLGEKPQRRESRWVRILDEVTNILVAKYGTPTLGNFRDPVKEIFYILLSARTNERLYKKAHRQLMRAYPTLESLAKATPRQALKCIKIAGLGSKRAKQVVLIARRLIKDLGPNPSRKLKSMSAGEVYRYLTSLPGVGPKSAFCVMMYSLDCDVFPVDANINRIFCRMGIIPLKSTHREAQQLAPHHVKNGKSHHLHITLLELGRHVCLPLNPKCHECNLSRKCFHFIRNMQVAKEKT